MASPSTPPTNQQQQLYQPFRPPPSPVPSKFRSLDLEARLAILRDRLGLWYEYATLIPSLLQQGFSPSSLEEATGISGVEQNRLVVAAQVRDTLAQSKLDPETLSFFDNGGAEILYEIRLLSVTQRAATARYMVENRFDARAAQELARAIKDFPRRRGDKGWESFNYLHPGDCLSFMYFRQSREHKNPSDQRTSALERALEVAETEKAKERILDELKVKSGGDEKEEIEVAIKVPVVRMKIGEVAEASTVVVLPSCKAEEGEIAVVEAPEECRSEGEFGVVAAEKGWKRWVVLPGWDPVVKLGSGVVVEFRDARVLPWKVKRWYKEESILVVADRQRKEVVADDGFYLISDSKQGDNGFKVERGSKLKELGVKDCMGSVVLVVRPPKEEIEDQLADEDWE
ncbi:hypothetical protein BVC80_9099g262 [Macleaya cordata]|uniref:Rubisco accumulation factor 1 n=1 Tax=Macleaya cordata TaxID=56857 RepID=A0A200PW58_MACCD|nr:hypothetical protein BVC80_9099g262 [Macleaya cordata]